MAEDVKKLLLQIDASVELLKRNLNQGDDRIERFERDTKRRLQSVDRSFVGLGRGVDTLNQKFNLMRGAIAAVGIGYLVSGFTSLISKSFELGASLNEQAQQLGVSSRALQVYRFIGGQVGIANETMDRSLQKLNRSLGEAALGAARPTRALQAFGFSLAEIRRGLTVEEAIPRLADGFARIENSGRRAAVEVVLFGRAGQEVDNLLTQGGRRINEMADAAERMGLVLSDDQINRLDEAADKYDALKTILSAQIAAVVADNVDAILSLITALGDLIRLAGMAGRAWENFRLELEASRIEHALSSAGSTPPEWGQGGRGRALEGRERLDLLTRESEIRERQLQIARETDPNYRPPSMTPTTPPRSRRTTTAEPDLDSINGGSSTPRPRTDAQVYRDFEAALRREGVRPTSGFRTREQQARLYRSLGPGNAAPPGSSDHEVHKAFDFGANVDRAALQRAAAAAGVRLGPELVHGRRRHLHQTFSDARGQGGGEEALARAEEEARRQREQQLRDDFQYDTDIRRARATTLQAQLNLATDSGERTELSTRILDIEREQESAALELSVKLGDRTRAQADALMAEYDVADGLRFQALQIEEQGRRREAMEQLEAQRAEIARSLLEGEADLATTAAERRRIELLILQHAYDEERARLQRIVRESRDADERQRASERLASLPAQLAQNQARARRATQGPLEQYLQSLPRTAEELNERLEEVAASGLQSLNDGLVDAIMGAKSLGEVFKNVSRQIIADLLRIAIQRSLIEPLANALFGAPGGKGGGGGFSSIIASLGSLFGGGKAIGGGVSPNRIYEVGERGRELFVPSVAGNIVPNHAIGGGGVALNMNWTLNAPGADPAALGRLQQSIENFSAQFEARVVGVVQDAIDRRMIR